MSQHGNAEASCSRLPRSIVIRRKSQDALKKATAQSSPSTTSRALTENTKIQLPRAVKTVPRESGLRIVTFSTLYHNIAQLTSLTFSWRSLRTAHTSYAFCRASARRTLT